MKKNIFVTTILLITTPIIIFLLLFLGYNIITSDNNAILAQEPELVCEDPEIPVGIATDATLFLAKRLLTNAQNAVSAAFTQIALAEQLITLPDECQADNCSAGCTTLTNTVSCGTDNNNCSTLSPCGAQPCWTKISGSTCELFCTSYSCQTNPCSGDPCPRNAINNIINAIEANQNTIKVSKDNINKLFNDEFKDQINGKDPWEYCSARALISNKTLPNLISCLLEESRTGLSACTTPEGVNPLEEGKGVLTCQQGIESKVLTDKQQNQCYPNNFYCCYFK